MKIYADYHTHTIYSHGTGKIEDNARVASEKGLKEIAITDHGFNHQLYNVMRKDIPLMRRQIEELKDKYNVKILLGVEANLISSEGDIDVEHKDEEKLDIILMGFHKRVFAKRLKDRFGFFIPNFFAKIFGYSKKRIDINTQAYLKAIEKNNIDIITHLGYGMEVDAVKIAKSCKEHNVYLELNGKRILFKECEMQKIIDTGVTFIISSDAHRPSRVGECPLGISYVLKYNIPIEQIANINKITAFKKHN
ncbi:MAG: PHP domain-containing protein [Clostridia bacterium]|nr:PHP domain-containing protein [Clostridia bacterium]